jgi:hypothetical protein
MTACASSRARKRPWERAPVNIDLEPFWTGHAPPCDRSAERQLQRPSSQVRHLWASAAASVLRGLPTVGLDLAAMDLELVQIPPATLLEALNTAV